MSDTVRIIRRDKAITAIAGSLADRTDYVIAVPPHLVAQAAERFTSLPSTWFVDNGETTVLRTTKAALIAAGVSLLAPLAVVAAVVTVPKTTPVGQVREALGDLVPSDGSRDIALLLDSDDAVVTWPLLFVDALTAVDPKAGAQLRASDLRTLS